VQKQNVASKNADPSRPNVILIVMDTVRADHLSLYGYERDTTPNLRKFAETATVYTNAIAPGDMTLSTHASLFTGMYPSWHHAHYDPWNSAPAGRPLSSKFHTLAEVLCEKGYSTIAVVANRAYLSPHFGLNQGFRWYDWRAPVPFLTNAHFYSIRKGIRDLFICLFSHLDSDLRNRRAKEVNKEVFNRLNLLKQTQIPFFIFINYMDAHDPYIPPPPFDTLYTNMKQRFSLASYHEMRKDVMKLKRDVTDKEFSLLLSQYDAGIAYIDYHIGKLIARLSEFGLYENTLLIITSDHGEAFGRRSLLGHGSSVYQDQIRVPLIIKWPDIPRPKVVVEPVSIVDLMPTVLKFETPSRIHGRSLLDNGRAKRWSVFSESFPHGDYLTWHPRFNRIERAVFSESFKFIGSTSNKKEIYDLSKDSAEQLNFYTSENVISKRLETELHNWINGQLQHQSTKPVKLDKQTFDRLKSLGYAR
jgi:arylsulfatase A-like enzyme